jgi:cytochrome c peroxidase
MKKQNWILSLLICIALMACKYDVLEQQEEDNNTNALVDDFSLTTPYPLDIPPFFPPMDIPQNNPLTQESVLLGKYLFWEKKLSLDNSISCGSCHLPESSFSDPNRYSAGVGGTLGDRQSMALINLGWARNYFWDGRKSSLEDQILEPVENPIEMHEQWSNVVLKLAEDTIYPPMFRAAFGSVHITKERAAKAIASFIRTMVSAGSKFDKQRIGQYTFTPEEYRGFILFTTEGGSPEEVAGGSYGADCFHCHGFGDMQMTDGLFHNNGLDPSFQNDPGRFNVTFNPLDSGKFKTPTLRNVEYSAPYMHDGRFNTLLEVIEHYNTGGHPSTTIDSFMKFTSGGLQLSETSKNDLIAFLKCLSDTAFMNNVNFKDPHE